jgi:2,4-dienoyl-CoA reductase-like NADH-dependent reductase (Old Yellow Enzyme family)
MSNIMLFDTFEFSGLRLGNRMVRSATCEKLADEDGHVTDNLVELYGTLAQGGCGLIITGAAFVHPTGRYVPRMLSVHSDMYADGLRRLAEEVHRHDGLVALQLAHGGWHCPPLLFGDEEPLAPSAVYNRYTKATSRAMTDAEIWKIIDAFSSAAWRAREAGFDAVQIHAAHGLLASSFLSSHLNRRDDYWGGDEERRFHFAEEVFGEVRRSVGGDYPVLVKLNVDDLVEDGMKQEESLRVAKRLEYMGMDCVEISGGLKEAGGGGPDEDAYFRKAGALFKRGLNIPVILTGGMRSSAVMRDVLASRQADLVGLSRPLIREPDLPNLMKEGKEKADCVSCNRCARFSKPGRVRCRQPKSNRR